MARGPKKGGVYELKPKPYSVRFDGGYINLSALERETGIANESLSRIFKGRRRPSLYITQTLSEYFGFTVDEFLVKLEEAIVNTRQPAA